MLNICKLINVSHLFIKLNGSISYKVIILGSMTQFKSILQLKISTVEWFSAGRSVEFVMLNCHLGHSFVKACQHSDNFTQKYFLFHLKIFHTYQFPCFPSNITGGPNRAVMGKLGLQINFPLFYIQISKNKIILKIQMTSGPGQFLLHTFKPVPKKCYIDG